MSGSKWTSLTAWVAAFRRLHEDARIGRLAGAELRAYEHERDELAKALLTAQHLAVRPGQKARQALRISRVLPVELELGAAPLRTTTVDLAVGGFAVLLAKPPRVDQRVGFALELETQGEVLRGRARVVNLQRKGKPFRVALAFEGLSAAQARKIGIEVFEAALAKVPR